MSEFAQLFTLDPDVLYLNHGSFGACPRVVLEERRRLYEELERQPVLFLDRTLEARLDAARAALGRFVGADPDDLAFVANATSGVNAVARSLTFRPGDEILATDQEYNACRNVLDYVAARSGATVVVAEAPFPLRSADEIVEAIAARASARTRFALFDHVTSQTGLVFPAERIVRALRERGVERIMIDGAHAPGMIPLDIPALGADYYAGNCHKWICAPKGAALLWARNGLRDELVPPAVSHGYNDRRADRGPFRKLFDWQGTLDPTAALCVPAAISFLEGIFPGGAEELMARNRALALEARAILCDALKIEPPAPDEMIGALASVPLPDARAGEYDAARGRDFLQARLYDEARIEVPIMFWPRAPRRVLRVSAQIYNDRAQYEALAAALVARLR